LIKRESIKQGIGCLKVGMKEVPKAKSLVSWAGKA
jgi:hypothetical protein